MQFNTFYRFMLNVKKNEQKDAEAQTLQNENCKSKNFKIPQEL